VHRSMPTRKGRRGGDKRARKMLDSFGGEGRKKEGGGEREKGGDSGGIASA